MPGPEPPASTGAGPPRGGGIAAGVVPYSGRTGGFPFPPRRAAPGAAEWCRRSELNTRPHPSHHCRFRGRRVRPAGAAAFGGPDHPLTPEGSRPSGLYTFSHGCELGSGSAWAGSPQRSPNLSGSAPAIARRAGNVYQGCALPLSYGGTGRRYQDLQLPRSLPRRGRGRLWPRDRWGCRTASTVRRPPPASAPVPGRILVHDRPDEESFLFGYRCRARQAGCSSSARSRGPGGFHRALCVPGIRAFRGRPVAPPRPLRWRPTGSGGTGRAGTAGGAPARGGRANRLLSPGPCLSVFARWPRRGRSLSDGGGRRAPDPRGGSYPVARAAHGREPGPEPPMIGRVCMAW